MFKYEPKREFETVQAFCDLPFSKAILNGWGDLSMCCYQLEQLGSVLPNSKYPKGRTVLDLWNSRKAKEIREATLKNQLHQVCKSWNTCPFLLKNREPGEVRAYKDFAYPTYLEICLPNTHCNIGGEKPSDENPACIMCCRNYDMKPQPSITDLLCEKSISIMPYIERLCVLGVAEPFWKDALFRVFEKIEFHRWKHRCRFETNTNVVCLTPRTIERFFQEVEFSEISFSIDAASPETYLKIRRVDCYKIVIDHLKHFVSEREKYGGAEKHKTVVYNNINILNVHEMPKMVVDASQCGVDKITMIPTHDQCGRVDMGELLINEKNVKLFKRYADEAQQMAESLGIYLHYPKPFDMVPPPVGQEFIQLTLG